MRIMTSNIWGDYFGNPVAVREDAIGRIYRQYAPDILGFQEMTAGWYRGRLFEELHDTYQLIGTEAFDANNYVPMVVKKNFSLLAKGYEYLAHTPDESKGITWAVLQDAAGRTFAVCNTHFWWKPGAEHDAIRVQNAQQLVTVMQQLHTRYACPVWAFGDMNTTLSSEVFAVYAQNGIRHMRELAAVKSDVSSHHGDPVRGEDGRYHGSPTTNDYRASIDHIVALGDGFSVEEYRVIEDPDALDATDHSPVYVDVTLD